MAGRRREPNDHNGAPRRRRRDVDPRAGHARQAREERVRPPSSGSCGDRRSRSQATRRRAACYAFATTREDAGISATSWSGRRDSNQARGSDDHHDLQRLATILAGSSSFVPPRSVETTPWTDALAPDSANRVQVLSRPKRAPIFSFSGRKGLRHSARSAHSSRGRARRTRVISVACGGRSDIP